MNQINDMMNFTKCFINGTLLLSAAMFCETANAQTPQRKAAVDSETFNAEAVQYAPSRAEGEWEVMGPGKYRDDIITALFVMNEFPEFEVTVEKSKTTEGLYRIVSPYKNFPVSPAIFDGETYMEINATNPEQVYFTRYNTGMNWGNGNITINSMAGYEYEKGNFAEAVANGQVGTLADGNITFPISTLLVKDESPDVPETVFYVANKSGKFRLRLPGALELEASIEINTEQLVVKDEKEYIGVNIGFEKDVESVKVAMIDGVYSNSLVDDVINGTIASQEINAAGEVLFPYTADGIYTFIAVPYHKGVAKPHSYTTEELIYKLEGWKVVGEAQYSEGYLCDCEVNMGITAETTPCEVQESTDYPGLYRLVDPYGLNYKYATAETYDTTHRYYLEIDASDPNRVVIYKTPDGCGLIFNAGKMMLWSRADRYVEEGTMTEEEVEQKGLYGKLEGNVITFPKEALCINFIDQKDTWYWANRTGKFKVVLPEGSGINTVINNNADAPVELYNLQGVKVNAENATPGIYIKKQGNETEKIVIK